MINQRETKKLEAEELEKRVAPLVIYDTPEKKMPQDSEPVGGGGGLPDGTGGPSFSDQPGNSDDHRDKLWHENQ